MLKPSQIEPMHAGAASPLRAQQTIAVEERRRITLLFALITVSILIVLWPTTRSMIETWQRSSTYGHCYAVIPIALWMAWRQSAALVAVPTRPFWPGLALIFSLGFVWLLGELASAAVVSQFAAVGMIAATALTAFGWQWTRQLAFPLGFLFFAVPAGEELLPVLMDWTAEVTVAALRVTGIPVYREGNYFVIPSGSWSVIEACSGARYLIAALMTGCIFAWLQYSAPAKRVIFVLLALAMALIANWLRAYSIVLMGHLSDNRIGADHNVLGWVIFGAAMFALFAIGMRWTDSENRPLLTGGRAQPVASRSTLAALTACLLAIGAWPVAAALIEPQVDSRPVRIERIAARGEWQEAPITASTWKPELVGPRATSVQTFVRDGAPVSVYLGVYRNQEPRSDLVSAMNRVVGAESQSWRLIEAGTFEVDLNGQPTRVRAALLQSKSERLLVWNWYWLAGRTTGSDVRVKLQLALQRLINAFDTGAWVSIYTPVDDDTNAGVRRLSAFVEAMSGPLDVALEKTATQ